jgi:RNA polymerase sigma-70 factor (ECF subfamily)
MTAEELAGWLRNEIARLPPQQAAAFVLVYFEQLSRDEAAAALGVSPEAVSTALYKARQQFRTQLAKSDRGGLP